MKGSALRFESTAAMPAALRRRVLAQQAGAPVAPRLPKAPSTPRRDEEHNEQVLFFNRIRTLALNDPRFALAARRTFAIPNGGGRSKCEAGRLKAEGVTKGVSDISCSLPCGTWHGLFIEMKSRVGRPTPEQKAWIEESLRLRYLAVVCHSANEAFDLWREYSLGKRPHLEEASTCM